MSTDRPFLSTYSGQISPATFLHYCVLVTYCNATGIVHSWPSRHVHLCQSVNDDLPASGKLGQFDASPHRSIHHRVPVHFCPSSESSFQRLEEARLIRGAFLSRKQFYLPHALTCTE
mmetsp:Transcript_18475/g.26603  ORF Transcript_18475/g.26603 Transcript_18475/m.26603 type:complete len:117 (+) Transcript_18475:611-961(+)